MDTTSAAESYPFASGKLTEAADNIVVSTLDFDGHSPTRTHDLPVHHSIANPRSPQIHSQALATEVL
jgi:hypothetical protein